MNHAIDISHTIEPKSDQLNADDLLVADKVITITNITTTEGDQQPVSIHYEGDDGRPYKPCKSMRRVLVAAWGGDASKWVGQSLRLFGDPEVKFGGQRVGGIRISHMTGIGSAKSFMLTVTRGRKAEYRVEPMEAPNRSPVSDELFAEKLPAIRDLIDAGDLTPERAIASFEQNYGSLTQDQRAQLRAIGGDA